MAFSLSSLQISSATDPFQISGGSSHLLGLPADVIARHILDPLVRDCPGMRVILPFVCRRIRTLSGALPRTQFFSDAIARGRFRILGTNSETLDTTTQAIKKEWLLLLDEAAKEGWLSILKWAQPNTHIWEHRIHYEAKWNTNYSILVKDACLITAARYGQMRVFEWGRENNRGFPLQGVCAAATLGGHLDLLTWVTPNAGMWVEENLFAIAARKGNLKLLELFHAEVLHWTPTPSLPSAICSHAARKGHLPILQWAKAKGLPLKLNVCLEAARGGHLHVLKWAIDNGAPTTSAEICSNAAGKGHLLFLQEARQRQIPWNEGVCARAARAGHLTLLKWARANGAAWNTTACYKAAGGGHLEVLKWLRANGAPWDENVCNYAAREGHLHVLQWAHENGALLNLEEARNFTPSHHKQVRRWLNEIIHNI